MFCYTFLSEVETTVYLPCDIFGLVYMSMRVHVRAVFWHFLDLLVAAVNYSVVHVFYL